MKEDLTRMAACSARASAILWISSVWAGLVEDSSSDIDRRALSRVGTTIGERWRLTSLLGVGGMAAVYAAERVSGDGPDVAAIKMLHPELSADSFIRKRFVREGYVANSIAHPGAVKVYDNAEAEDGSLYLEMELLDGMTLEDRCDSAGRLPVDEVIDLVHQLLSVLEDAHARNILHRDLKPENLFLTVDGELKVLDFGIARIRQGDGRGTTQTGDVMGTPLFMAPEQARGRWDEVDVRSDLWAVGAVAFTLLAGRPVHITKTSTEALVKVVTEPVVPLSLVVDGLPRLLTDWVDRALAFEKQQRFDDATSMRLALEEVSDRVLQRRPASRIAFDTQHPLSQRKPSWGGTEAIASDDGSAEPETVPRPDSSDTLPTLVASSPGRSSSPAWSGSTPPREVALDVPVTRASAPSLDAVAGPPSDSLSIPTRRTPWALVGALSLLLGGTLAVFIFGGTETAAGVPSSAVSSVAEPEAPPTPEPPPAPEPEAEPEPSPEPEVVPEAAPDKPPSTRTRPAPAAPRPSTPAPEPVSTPKPDDPYGRRH